MKVVGIRSSRGEQRGERKMGHAYRRASCNHRWRVTIDGGGRIRVMFCEPRRNLTMGHSDASRLVCGRPARRRDGGTCVDRSDARATPAFHAACLSKGVCATR